VSEIALTVSQKRNLERLRQHLEEEILLANSHMLQSHPIESYVQQLDNCERDHGYRFVPPKIRSQCKEITTQSGLHGLELYHRLLLVTLIEQYDERQKRYRIPDSIKSLILREFDRILSGMESTEEEFYVHDNDLFAKDLGLCRLKLLPCGSEVLDLWSGVSRSTLFCSGVSQFLREGFFLVARVGGFKPLYESHWDRRLVRQFTMREYDLCYARTAELLELNPDVKGMFGSSWWFDPQLEDIAPELLFLRQVPEENGARIFRIGPDASAVMDAIKFSKKRRALYESGKFMPSRYMLVWARDDMLDWARRFVASEKQVSKEQSRYPA
jgi:hypothetical protein